MEIVLYTGKGGKRVFHNAVMADANARQYYQRLGEVAIKEYNGKLTYGAYADRYKTIDGHIITVRETAIFDHGRIAEMQRLNGDMIDGFPRASYTMVFVDHSVYESERNIQYVCESGNEFMEGVYAGFTQLPDMWKALRAKDTNLSTTKDEASYEVKGSHGIAMLKNTTSFILERE